MTVDKTPVAGRPAIHLAKGTPAAATLDDGDWRATMETLIAEDPRNEPAIREFFGVDDEGNLLNAPA